MARQIIIDDREWIEMVNTKGEVIGGFYWNPTDLDILKRYEQAEEELEKLEVPENGDANTLLAVSDKIKKMLDTLLNSNASETVFKNCNPLSPCSDGRFWCEHVFEHIAKFIESEFDVRIKKTSARIKKYTGKYRK